VICLAARPIAFMAARAIRGPNRHHQNRTVAWLMSTPRSWSRSSTLRSDSRKRIYIIAAGRVISCEVLK